MIAGNARNPYPLYLLFRKTESFTYEELVNTFECLHEADLRLKTTGDNPEIVLETVIYHICRGGKYV